MYCISFRDSLRSFAAHILDNDLDGALAAVLTMPDQETWSMIPRKYVARKIRAHSHVKPECSKKQAYPYNRGNQNQNFRIHNVKGPIVIQMSQYVNGLTYPYHLHF